MTAPLTVSAIQYEALGGGIDANVPEHVRLIEDADSHGARLVVFPELSLTGYDLPLLRGGDRRGGDHSGGDQWVAPGDHRLDPIREICRRTGITAVVGAPLREGDGTLRLASLAVHPNGTEEAGFKTHLHGDEQALFEAGPGYESHAGLVGGPALELGREPLLLDVDGWKIALAICFDAAHPAHSGGAAAAGADVYAVSALYTQEEGHRLGLHLGARAMDNRMYGVLANLGGRTPLGPSCGLSGFWGPDGLSMQQAGSNGTEVVTAVLRRGSLDRYRG
ncbi:carbon-nitrogen hydrolase family protein [Arthrobacter sp. NPDC056493]|uniref:carbon-nitrogen hydrolase family protein n=1 Tax=Arthrobacter sp. NPDC056493 TaxID=3345839 RepID=UPI00366FDF7F